MKLTKRTTLKISAVIALYAGVTACSHGPTVQDFADTSNPTVEVNSFDAEMTGAMANQVNVLSPRNFQEAQDNLNSAKKSLDKQKDAKDTLHYVAVGHAYLVRSNEFATLAHANIEDVIIARQDAIKAGAPGYFSADFMNADKNLKAVTAEIEKNDLKDAASNRSNLQASYLDLELKSTKEAYLGKSQATIALAIKEGAKDYAPRSLAIAQKSEIDSEAFITANRHDSEQLTARSTETRTAADHLLKITRSSRSGKKTSSEDNALALEGEQNQVVAKQDQINTKDDQLDAKDSQIDSKNNQVRAEIAANQALNNENKNLEADKAFNRSFDEARAEFTSSEAEVYKQGNTLMIRLRGLEFPTAQAVLKGSNFPLLAKVQKVIKDFGKSSVIVEGHTDSRGGKLLNEKLSTNRAQAVKDYFVANAGSDTLDIKSIGYDYQKPLASNKTPDGRAQNRRVDILIQAEEPAKM